MLSKTADYALRAVVLLASRNGQPASADTLAEKTKVPRRYLHRVLQDLAKAGLVSCHRQKLSEVRMAKKNNCTSLYNILFVLQLLNNHLYV